MYVNMKLLAVLMKSPEPMYSFVKCYVYMSVHFWKYVFQKYFPHIFVPLMYMQSLLALKKKAWIYCVVCFLEHHILEPYSWFVSYCVKLCHLIT